MASLSLDERNHTNISIPVNGSLDLSKNIFASYPPKLLDSAAVCIIIFSIVGVTGNFISILALSRCKRLRNATTAFIVNLCLADMFFSFSMPETAIIFLERSWNYDELLCKCCAFFQYSNSAVSLFSVFAITLNRYIHILHPFAYENVYSRRNIAIMIASIWIIALTLLLPPLAEIWGKLGYNPEIGTCTIMSVDGKSPMKFLYIMAFGLPSFAFIVCYVRIFCIVRTTAEKIRKVKNIDISTSRGKKALPYNKQFLRKKSHSGKKKYFIHVEEGKPEMRILRIMLMIFITFVLCYFPAFFMKYFKKEDEYPYLNVFSYLTAYFSNIINPVIYVGLSKEYGRAYKELFCRKRDIQSSSVVTVEK